MKKSIQIKRTALYHHLESPDSQNLLYVIHGYAQLAVDFLGAFEKLKGKIELIAPEALSRFYNKQRQPVASWMTSHERDSEIQDYVNYLDQLHQELSSGKQYKKIKLLGYSQGVSTAMRWLAQSKIKFDSVYLCSGSIPPELKAEDLKKHSQTDFHYFFGNEDPLMKESQVQHYISSIKGLHHNVSIHSFEGGHEISKACLDLIVKKS